jgi:hypothetical protein
VVEVPEEGVQRPDALEEAALDLLPLGRRHQPRHRIEGDGPLDALLVGRQRERHADVVEHPLGQRRPALPLVGGESLERLVERRAVRERPGAEADELVVAGGRPVRGQDRRRGRSHAHLRHLTPG